MPKKKNTVFCHFLTFAKPIKQYTVIIVVLSD